MSILHIINRAPSVGGVRDARLQRLRPGDALLLIEDGCYAARTQTPSSPLAALADGVRVYVLEEDMMARGITADADGAVTTVDYEGFVDLTAQHSPVISWR